MGKKSDRRDKVAEVIRAHDVDMSGSAFGGGWDLWEARCRTCGSLPRDEWPADHVARILDEHRLIARA